MSKWDKLLLKILQLSNNLRFEEIQKVLEAFGYQCVPPKSGSSHCTFRKPSCAPVTIPRHNPVKKEYVKMVKAAIEREEREEEK